jgi:hypothetical protein
MSGVIKNRARWILGSLVAAGVATAIIVLVFPARRADAPSSETVKIELRGKPVAKLRMNGKRIGTTPTTIIVPRGKQPLELEATFTVEKIGLPQPTKKIETYRQIRQVVPDAEQSVDFAIDDAVKIDVTVERR